MEVRDERGVMGEEDRRLLCLTTHDPVRAGGLAVPASLVAAKPGAGTAPGPDDPSGRGESWASGRTSLSHPSPLWQPTPAVRPSAHSARPHVRPNARTDTFARSQDGL